MKWTRISKKQVKAFDLKNIITKIQDRYHELMDIGSWSDAEWFKKGEYAYIYIPVNKFDFRKNVTTSETDKEAVEALEELNGQKVEIIKIKATIKGSYDVMTADAKPTLVDVRFENGQIWEDVNTEWLKHKPFGEDEDSKKVKALNLSDFNPIKQINKLTDFTEGEWFNVGDKAKFNLDKSNFDLRKNTTTGEIDKSAEKYIDSLNGQIVEIISIDETEGGSPVATAQFRKPTFVTVKFKNGQEWKKIPVTWLSKKDVKEVESKIVKQDGKYQAQSEKGKSFGTYDTKAEAEKRLQQMEMFKNMKSEKDLSKIMTPEDFDKIESEIDSLIMQKKRIMDSLNSLAKAKNKGSEYQNLLKEAEEINNKIIEKNDLLLNMYKELNLEK